MYKNVIYANNPINKSEPLLKLFHEIDEIKFDKEGDKLTTLILECIGNNKSDDTCVNILIGYAFVMGYIKTLEVKESFLALTNTGFLLSSPLITRHTFELWAATYYAESCLQQSFKEVNTGDKKRDLQNKIKILVTGTKLPEKLFKNKKNLEKPIHIMDMIRALEKGKSNEAKQNYDILSEFCHPNFNFNSIPIGMYAQYDYRMKELDPNFEKALIFQFTLQKRCLLGIKESLGNIADQCLKKYDIKWEEPSEKSSVNSIIPNEKNRKENFFYKIQNRILSLISTILK